MAERPAGRISYDVFALADIQDDRYELLARTVHNRLKGFKCERSKHLQDFARGGFRRWEEHGSSRTYVLITEQGDSIDVAAFFTIGMATLNFEKATNSVRKRLMGSISQDHTGAYCIAELARSDDYSGTQLPGETILNEAKEVIKRARRYVAGRFVVVDARSEVFEALYKPAGFRMLHTANSPVDMPDVEFITAGAIIKDW